MSAPVFIPALYIVVVFFLVEMNVPDDKIATIPSSVPATVLSFGLALFQRYALV